MSAPAILSDPTLLTSLRGYGRFDTTGCYQCGSCTVSCDLVTDFVSIPRKSIRYGLLGLRGPLRASLEPWICHDCGECSIACPRQADPRASMMTLRRYLTAQYDWTRISSKLLTSRAWYLGSLAATGFVTLLLILFYHLWYAKLGFSDFVATPMELGHMFPIITYYTLTVVLLPLLFLLTRASRMWWLTMRPGNGEPIPFAVYVREMWTYVEHSIAHTLMRKCPERGRWLGHWLLAFGTALMLAVKVCALTWFQTDNIYPLYHPQRWLGYLAAACIVYGIGDILLGRVRATKEFYKETRLEDLVFPVLLVLTALSGIAVHVFRYAGFPLTCHLLYAIHITVATPMLVVEMSFGKWAHMIYRPLALYFQAVNERARPAQPIQEGLRHVA